MAKTALTIKPTVTSFKQLIDDLDRNALAYQVEKFFNNGGKIQQLEGFNYKPLKVNPCGWQL